LIGAAISEARSISVRAEEVVNRADAARVGAFARFDHREFELADAAWKQVIGLEDEADRARQDATGALDRALALDPRDQSARSLYADIVLARFLAAERLHEHGLLATLRSRLRDFDDGTRLEWLAMPAQVRIETNPPGMSLTLARYRENAARLSVESDARSVVAGARYALDAGSYVVVARAPGRYTTRYPFVVTRGEVASLRIDAPLEEDVPEGMIFIPAGAFTYGSSDVEEERRFAEAEPAHRSETHAFLIARTEVNNAEYVAFLEALPVSERSLRTPVGLTQLPGGKIGWKFREATLLPGEDYCGGAGTCISWANLPVDGASSEDAGAYVTWLARKGRLAGARLCTDKEWIRAARGADDRRVPNGDGVPTAEDACLRSTRGASAAPCAAGSHPASRSPFGVEDMIGSVSEWITPEWRVPPTAGEESKTTVGLSAGNCTWNDYGKACDVASAAHALWEGPRLVAFGFRVCADAPLAR
jgi:formylglycine-generating enzyme required for sulfatase activity